MLLPVVTGLMDSSHGSEDSGSSHLDSIDVQLRVLPNKLRIGKIAIGDLPAAAFPLLNLVLFPAPEYVMLACSLPLLPTLLPFFYRANPKSPSPHSMQAGKHDFFL